MGAVASDGACMQYSALAFQWRFGDCRYFHQYAFIVPAHARSVLLKHVEYANGWSNNRHSRRQCNIDFLQLRRHFGYRMGIFVFGNTIGLCDDQFIVQTTKRIHPYAQIWGRHAGNAALFVGILGAARGTLRAIAVHICRGVIVGIATFLCGRSRFCAQRGRVHITQEIGDERKLSDDDSCAWVYSCSRTIREHHWFRAYLVALCLWTAWHECASRTHCA